MTLYRLETKKRWGGAEWGNRYHVNVADQTAAISRGQELLEAERLASWNQVEFVGVRVSTAVADGRTGRTFPKTGTKMGAVVFTNAPPIEVCARILLLPGVQQPGVKFYHFSIDGDEMENGGMLMSAALTRLNTLATSLAAIVIADALGGSFTSASAAPRAHVHQMYRAWAAREGVDIGD